MDTAFAVYVVGSPLNELVVSNIEQEDGTFFVHASLASHSRDAERLFLEGWRT
jgi:hypothetical protein